MDLNLNPSAHFLHSSVKCGVATRSKTCSQKIFFTKNSFLNQSYPLLWKTSGSTAYQTEAHIALCSSIIQKRHLRKCVISAATHTEQDESRRLGRSEEYTVVMKFGGSSVATADRMRTVADLVQGFENEMPVIVLSAMGKTTNNLLKVSVSQMLRELSLLLFFALGRRYCHEL